MAPPTILTGSRSTANVNQVRRFIDLRREITNIDTGSIPLVILLSQMRRRPAFDSRFRWLEDRYVPQTATVPGGATSGATAITVNTGEGGQFRANGLIFVPSTGEHISVTSVDTSTDILTVVRGYGGTTAATIASAAEIISLGVAMPEGSGAPELRTTVSTEVFNFVQTFKWAFELTNEWGDEVDELAEDDKQYQRQKGLEEHLQRIEWQLWFGARNEDVSNAARPRRSTGGVNRFITFELDVSGAGGSLTQTGYINFLETVFKVGSGTETKWQFAAPRIHSVISQFAQSAIRVAPEDELFGIKIMQYQSAHGIVNIVQHRKFAQFTFGAGLGFALDMNLLALRVLRDTFRKDNVQNNDEDLEKDMYISKFGLEFINPDAHGRLVGVTN